VQRPIDLPAIDVECRYDTDVSHSVAADFTVPQATGLLWPGAVVLDPLQQGTGTIANARDGQPYFRHDCLR
jgi:hypothetical protein